MKNRMSSKLRRFSDDMSPMKWNRARFRRLKPRERVWVGDYMKNPLGRYEPWDGPGGFSARYFAKPVYRLKRN